ncbi:MAG: extracellular solute-binding protein [Clostridia bacterium]|nr:extracellular solute-binding protein [Clostridia bacterium]
MKKKITAIGVIIALLASIFSLAACGGTPPEETTPTITDAPITPDTTAPVDEFGRDIIEDSVDKSLDFEGETVNLLCRSDAGIIDEFTSASEDATVLNEAVFKRNETVADRLNVELNIITMNGAYGDANTKFLTEVRGQAMSAVSEYDIAALYASQGCMLVTENLFWNLYELPHLDLEKPWWTQSYVDEITYADKLYSVIGDVTITALSRVGVTFFNKDLAEEKLAADVDLYKLVDEGKWTVDKLYELSKDVYVDVNGNDVRDAGDIFGYSTRTESMPMDLWVGALDIKVTTKNSDGIPELTFYTDRTVTAFEKLHNLIYQNNGCIYGQDLNTTVSTFVAGEVLFLTQGLLRAEKFIDMNDAYGILPMPMLDETQGGYYTLPQNAHSMMVVLNNCFDEEASGATLELLGAESYRIVRPAYYEMTMKGRYVNGEEDAEMFDLIVEGIQYNFGTLYSSKGLSAICALFRDVQTPIASRYEKKASTYEASLKKLLEDLSK